MSKNTVIETSKPDILQAAVALAKKYGLTRFSRQAVAAQAGVSDSTVSYHFGHMIDLRKEVVKYAAENEIVSILADARAARESFGPIPMTAALKERVASYIAGC